MLPLNTIEEAMKQVCTDYMKGEKKMKKIKLIILYLLFPGVILIWCLCGWYMFFKESFGREQSQ